jgi:hypothetical protein
MTMPPLSFSPSVVTRPISMPENTIGTRRDAVGARCGQLQMEGVLKESARMQQIDQEDGGQQQRCGGEQPDLEMQFVHSG